MKYGKTSVSKLCWIAVLLGAAACHDEHPPPAAPASERMGATMAQPGGDSSLAAGRADSSAAPPPEATASPSETRLSTLDDAGLADIVQRALDGAIRMALLAENTATSREVKHFAHEMVSFHENMQSVDSALYARIHLVPTSNPVSEGVDADVQRRMATLLDARGRSFDLAYVDAQLAQQTDALELVDRIIAHVENAELKQELEGVRTKLEAHVRMASAAKQALQAGKQNRDGLYPWCRARRAWCQGWGPPECPARERARASQLLGRHGSHRRHE
jgi:predicted outer membrane protein